MNIRKRNDTLSNNPSRGRKTFSLSSPSAMMALAFMIGLLIRIIYLSSFRESPFFNSLIVDAQWHDEWARGWAEGAWSMEGRSFFRAPLYPFWLSLIYRLFGHDLLVVRIVQAVLGAGTVAALAGCGWRIAGRTAALWSAAIAALYGPFIFFDAELLIPNLLVTLLAWSLFFLLAPPSSGAFLASASFLGLAAIARPSALILLPATLLFMWVRIRMDSGLQKRLIAWVILVMLLPSIGITLLNAKEERTFVFIASQGGVNFYAGNNPKASGRTVEIPELIEQGGWTDFVNTSYRVAEEDRGKPLNSRQVSNYWVQKGWNWISSEPVDAFFLTLKKAYYLLNAYEISNNRDLYLSPPFPLNLLLWKVSFFAFPWGLIFPLAVVGAILGIRIQKNRKIISLLVGWVFLYGLFLVPFFVNARFRLGMVPAMILLAAFALSEGKKMLRFFPLAAGILTLLLINTSFFQVRAGNPVQEQAKLGTALIAANRIVEGRLVLQKAFEAEPNSAKYAYLLGEAYLLEGNKKEALDIFRQVVNLDDTSYRLLTRTGKSLIEMRCYTDAAAALEKAATLRSPEGEVLANLGLAYEYCGQEQKALEAYSRSIRAAPDDPTGYLALGTLFQRQGKPDSAIAIWRQGAECSPNSFGLHFNLALAYLGAGQLLAGLQEITTALRIRPDNPEAIKLRAWFEQQIRSTEQESRQ